MGDETYWEDKCGALVRGIEELVRESDTRVFTVKCYEGRSRLNFMLRVIEFLLHWKFSNVQNCYEIFLGSAVCFLGYDHKLNRHIWVLSDLVFCIVVGNSSSSSSCSSSTLYWSQTSEVPCRTLKSASAQPFGGTVCHVATLCYLYIPAEWDKRCFDII